MKEEDGEDDTGGEHDERESVGEDVMIEIHFKVAKSKVEPDQPDHITHWADCNVDPSGSLTEYHSRISLTETDPTESEEGHRREDNEGGLSVEDLQGGFISEV